MQRSFSETAIERMTKIRQFGRVRHTGGSDDGEERVGDNDRAVGQNDDCEVVEDEAEAFLRMRLRRMV